MNYILAFVGPSGSGKTALILELLKVMPERVGILKSTTTRMRRSDEDDVVYTFISVEQAQQTIANNQAATHTLYAGNYYIYEKIEVEQTLTKHHGCCAVVEEVVHQLVNGGYPLKVIRIIPQNQQVDRGDLRRAQDIERSKIQIPVDLVINNSFAPGGLQKATAELVDFVSKL